MEGGSSHGSSNSCLKAVQFAFFRGRTSIIFCFGMVEVNLMYLWSLIDDSSRTLQSVIEFVRLGDVKVKSITDFPTGEWNVGEDPLFRIFKPY